MSLKSSTVLIVDDVEFNRMFLTEILQEEYQIIEASNGIEALDVMEKRGAEIDIVLLDAMMPEMDGFGVLQVMNTNHWIENIPVVMISAENSSSYISKGYELGVVDYIGRPFDPNIVKRRISNTIVLYARQKAMQKIIEEQIREKEKNNSLMVDILSTIVEFRNGESGLHVQRIRIITEILLEALARKDEKYRLTPAVTATISNAAALHDIGKIAIPEEILNKPGKLTKEEYEEMKKHAELGAKMLEQIHLGSDEDLLQYAHAICLYHHERWDGGGYPYGLKGEDIPLCAQVVSIADVYDALVSERVYKPPYSHEKAVEMIVNGECGKFNPDIMLVFLEEAKTLELKIQGKAETPGSLVNINEIYKEVMKNTAK